ncbi:uncharacterized protein LOC130985110 [Salvia miltiorrhiza]|uniref:uncharacterized protein LOC130985110 n=1 Tax=Salvia miltiorrhiza TaxID=226208 RepID=UPI0025AD694A|nr:uncharacterized protein LOC130985110 [Salvia miltiorrhiza]
MNGILLRFVAVAALSALLAGSAARELRPSDHGLGFQETSSPPPRNGEEQEMRSFFGASTVQLPEAKNISDTWLGAHTSGIGGGGAARETGRDHVRLGLLVATAVCGLTGVVLLAISGVIFLFRLRISSTSPPTPIHAESKISG